MNCDEALLELEAYLDRELPGDTRLEIERHLAGCSPCFQRGEFRSRLREIIRRKCSAVHELPPAVADRIRAAISGDA